MRLWHKDMIDVLPRQQLLGQWRELCAIMRNIEEKGTPGHILVNRVMDYEPLCLYTFAQKVNQEMLSRGYKCDFYKFLANYEKRYGNAHWSVDDQYVFPGWMNDRYLQQCYFNLQEKYDCGGISEEEWKKIYDKFWNIEV